jgi:hypothetical protein
MADNALPTAVGAAGEEQVGTPKPLGSSTYAWVFIKTCSTMGLGSPPWAARLAVCLAYLPQWTAGALVCLHVCALGRPAGEAM